MMRVKEKIFAFIEEIVIDQILIIPVKKDQIFEKTYKFKYH